MGTSSSSHPSTSAAALLSRRSASARGSSGEDAVRGGGRGHKSSSSRSSSEYVRRAHHAGSWYDSSASILDAQLSEYLSGASNEGGGEREDGRAGRPRAVVSPHAGFRYSGPTAAYAYLALREALSSGRAEGRPTTVVVLHPSHHVRLDGCAVSGANVLETPIANLNVDSELRSELLGTGDFLTMDRHIDEAEHSGEMQYPFIAKAITDAAQRHGGGSLDRNGASLTCRVLPIMVGALGTSAERRYGHILAPYLSRPDVFTVVSSDFCHWGRRFGYVPNGEGSPIRHNDIADYIEWLDQQGMHEIELQRPGAFADYLRAYSNTICGRHPIGVWLQAMAANREAGTEMVDVRFVRYAQSGRVRSMDESSVSYASAVARISTQS